MPGPRRDPLPAPPAGPEDWRPQEFGRGFHNRADLLVEPGWGGVRVIAHVAQGRARFVDEEGVDCSAEFAEVAEALAASVLAGTMILDGHLTVEPTQPTAGVAVAGPGAPGSAEIMGQMFFGKRRGRSDRPARRLDPDRPVAFVAVDLLSIDDSSLLEVPLLERKRLLDSAISEGDLVRVTPFVRPPIGTFVSTWRGLGFTQLAYKAANSRYRPGARNDDWSLTRMPPR